MDEHAQEDSCRSDHGTYKVLLDGNVLHHAFQTDAHMRNLALAA
ncbi:hypothetical protein [Streptomyces sp. NPDC001927]